MKEKGTIDEAGIMNLYRRGISAESISNYYSIPKEKVETVIRRRSDIQALAKGRMESASANGAMLRFIGKVLEAGKTLSSQEVRQKFGLQQGAYEVWRYADEHGYYAAAVARHKKGSNYLTMGSYKVKWSKDPEMRKLQEENERLKAENAYLKKKAEMDLRMLKDASDAGLK